MNNRIKTLFSNELVFQICWLAFITFVAMIFLPLSAGLVYIILIYLSIASTSWIWLRTFCNNLLLSFGIILVGVGYFIMLSLGSLSLYSSFSVEKIEHPTFVVSTGLFLDKVYLNTSDGPIHIMSKNIPFQPIYVLRASSSDGFLKNEFVCPSKKLTTDCRNIFTIAN